MKKAAVYTLLITATIVVFSAFRSFNERVKGNGNVKTEDRSAGSFDGISTSGIYKVVLTQGASESIRVEAEENLLPYIETQVIRGELDIHTKRGYSIEPRKDITIYETMKNVKSLLASGASGIRSTGQIKGKDLKISLSGATSVQLDLAVNSIDADLSGASKVDLSGKATSFDLGTSGAAVVDAGNLVTSKANIGTSGGSSVTVNVSESMNVATSGGSSVKYKGAASVQHVGSGGSSISKL